MRSLLDKNRTSASIALNRSKDAQGAPTATSDVPQWAVRAAPPAGPSPAPAPPGAPSSAAADGSSELDGHIVFEVRAHRACVGCACYNSLHVVSSGGSGALLGPGHCFIAKVPPLQLPD